MYKIATTIKNEILSYSKQERLFVLLAMICGFWITAEYAITKPTSNSIFLTHYSTRALPYAWMITLPLNFFVVSFYNRFLFKVGCFQMFLITTTLTIGVNLISAYYVVRFPPLSFFLYMWKDIYVLLMFQQLWSLIHSWAKVERAKYLYGLLFGVGGVGAILGSLWPSFFAVKIGSEHLLLMTLPFYLCLIISFYFLVKYSGFVEHKEATTEKVKHGFKLIFHSKTLQLILLIVTLMQVCAAILDYQFNYFLEGTIREQDLRTEFSGRIWLLINTLQTGLQFFATFLLVQFIGLKKSHFLIPVMLAGNALGAILFPTFALVTYSFCTIKIFDYSIFNIIKEMLYLPLKREEKFKAKAVIDVFAYRSAKVLACLFILGAQSLFPVIAYQSFSWILVVLTVTWIVAIARLMKNPTTQISTNTNL